MSHTPTPLRPEMDALLLRLERAFNATEGLATMIGGNASDDRPTAPPLYDIGRIGVAMFALSQHGRRLLHALRAQHVRVTLH